MDFEIDAGDRANLKYTLREGFQGKVIANIFESVKEYLGGFLLNLQDEEQKYLWFELRNQYGFLTRRVLAFREIVPKRRSMAKLAM